ncbi:hypothetical protein COV53_06980 [Candidatus Gottesmanbacteria bacterium CG11_big_fil_rev_8_21_14_0_20_37_11]|uniref:Uncharacterized protein n=3 Tax=Candidatus Gottesmaniibacteriota TaxID=1752720 RepID=A0A2M7RSD3_9BACT|nr:MAG: hypothetical protein AUJ73_01600 [Candidatus Gottesmanbacteria bacterium CG1_02_37_22]PIP33242.1 MAG: hypothetical protein COX23_00400 [Candidatus Gottesmanbacteria bacterium CG23_combo_of_CG06-09_8_20_14_all_37_19]PIR07700.1 MAG: hypothetical protein COV53_06980 [Candidatus Gottesmanbacteria bacterium CG11_big_fil_rev_8_21_14_0_20_37_11]PIZ02975.1 MAG: hypothetical protein COY59_01965 [Candidatus Gottesmanbacteria bacterium CG_4_10_14_0_8_um_filter_37_24]
MRRKLRKENIIKLLFFSVLFGIYVYIIPPVYILSYLGFYVIFLFWIYSTVRIFISKTRSVFWALIIFVYLLFRQFEISNLINTLLLLGIFLTLELYFRKR